MPNSRHKEAIVSPSLSRITNRIPSSMTELSFHGILLSAPFGPKSVTHVSGTFCYPCLGTDTFALCRNANFAPFLRFFYLSVKSRFFVNHGRGDHAARNQFVDVYFTN